MGQLGVGGRWPDLIEGCARCGADKNLISYARRGLCVPCERGERTAGRIESWPKIERDKEKLARAAARYNKDNYWRRKKAALIYGIVSNIGTTEASSRLEVSKKDIAKWMNGEAIPEELWERVSSLHDTLRRLTKAANSNEREEIIFEDFDLGVRFFNGKIM